METEVKIEVTDIKTEEIDICDEIYTDKFVSEDSNDSGWKIDETQPQRRKAKLENNCQVSNRGYAQITDSEKLEIIKLVKEGHYFSTIASRFNTKPSTVNYIMKKQKSILKRHRLLGQEIRIAHNKKSQFIQDCPLHKSLYEWYMQKQRVGESIPDAMLCEKAVFFNRRLGGPKSFKANAEWLQLFKQRYKIQSLKNAKLSEDILIADSYKEYYDFIQSIDCEWKNVYNCEETSLEWKSIPRKSDEKVKEERVTMAICSNSDGNHKLPIMIIGKSLSFENLSEIPVINHTQGDATMETKIFQKWYKEIFLVSTKANKCAENEAVVLMIDNAAYHPSKKYLEAIDPHCKLICVPMDKEYIQPMNQGIIEYLKKIYKKLFLEKLMARNPKSVADVNNFVDSWTIADFCKTLSDAWKLVPNSTITNAWERIRLVSRLTMDEKKYEEETKDITMDIVKLVLQVPSNKAFSHEEIDAWIHKDNFNPIGRILSDDEILQKYCNLDPLFINIDENRPNNDDSTTDGFQNNSQLSVVPSNGEAFVACKLLHSWIQLQPNVTTTILEQMEMINDFVADTTRHIQYHE